MSENIVDEFIDEKNACKIIGDFFMNKNDSDIVDDFIKDNKGKSLFDIYIDSIINKCDKIKLKGLKRIIDKRLKYDE